MAHARVFLSTCNHDAVTSHCKPAVHVHVHVHVACCSLLPAEHQHRGGLARQLRVAGRPYCGCACGASGFGCCHAHTRQQVAMGRIIACARHVRHW